LSGTAASSVERGRRARRGGVGRVGGARVALAKPCAACGRRIDAAALAERAALRTAVGAFGGVADNEMPLKPFRLRATAVWTA